MASPSWPQVDAAIDAGETVALARRLVAIPSYGPDHQWEAGVARVLEEFLRREGIAVARQPVVDGRENVLAALPGRYPGAPLLMLNGHMDTVPPSGSMRYPPFAAEVHDGRLWGRGAVDMKGAVAAMTVALAALRRAGVRPPRPVALAAVIAEEGGNLGTAALGIGGPPADLAVVGEPSGLAIIPAHRGVYRCEVVVHGRAAHGSTPELGVNAIGLAARLIVALDERLPVMWKDQRHPVLGGPSVNIGTIRGGIATNVVPDRCEFTFGKRMVPGDSPERVRADLEAVIAATIGAAQAELVGDARFDAVARPPLDIAADHPLVRTLADAVTTVTGRPAAIGRFQAFTDAAVLQAAGTPAVVFGPGDLALAHTDDEHVPVDALHAAARIYARVALRLCEADEARGPS
ncbi:MAG TPA: M20 family metallopeptidase [bacterium]|nr:M20 family metallopeptidase [bacterium]